jgi:hypothetical protein
MAGPYIFDRIKETSTTTGSGSLTLAGAASGYEGFANVGSGNTCFYLAEAGTEWEIGLGTYDSSTPHLARTRVLQSSQSDNKVNFSAGNKNVMLPVSASLFQEYAHESGIYNALSAYQAGRLLLPTNSFYLLRDNGSALQPWGTVYPMQMPDSSQFSWTNQGGASVKTNEGGIFLKALASATPSWRVRKKTLPSTTYSITMACAPLLYPGDFVYSGLLWRESSSGKLITFGLSYNGEYRIMVNHWDDPTTFSTTLIDIKNYANPALVWLRASGDSINRYYMASNDGCNFFVLDSGVRTDFMTANEIGFGVSTENSKDAYLTVFSWKEQY